MTRPRQLLEQSYYQALRACDPGRLVAAHLPDERPALVLAVGKAALSMAEEARKSYGRVAWLATPPADGGSRHTTTTASLLDGGLAPGTHPLPGADSVVAAGRALGMASLLTERDLLLVLISGGGSSLWCAPWGPLPAAAGDRSETSQRGVDLAVKRDVTLALQRAGADIHELNAVRRHLSRIKGGRLAAAAQARILTLALSDVPGDELSDIASGPTVADATTFAEALAVVRRYGVEAPAVVRHLVAGAAGLLPETPKPDSGALLNSSATVIGSSQILLETAARYWRKLGYEAALLSASLQGEARELARAHAELLLALRSGGDLLPELQRLLPDRARAREMNAQLARWRDRGAQAPPLVLLSGGEATVTVTGSGRGGRNLEFAGWLLADLRGRVPASGTVGADSAGNFAVWALSAGSDGIDGSSRAAGAFVTPDSSQRAEALAVDLDAHLADNDTDAFFERLDDRFTPGPTGNNLNDYRAILVHPAGS